MASAGGGRGKLVALLAVLLVALGGANYYRNYQADVAVERPYRGYSDAEIAELLEAYRSEAKALDRELGRTRERRAGPGGDGGLLAERVEDYEHARRRGERVRGLAREAASREAMVEALERERRIREELARGWRLHLERLVSF